MRECYICNNPFMENNLLPDTSYLCNCYRCGIYRISAPASCDIKTFIDSISKEANLSGWIYENQDVLITNEKLINLSKLRTPGVSDKASRILIYLSKKYPRPGQELPDIFAGFRRLQAASKVSDFNSENLENAKQILPLLSVGYAESEEELDYLIEDYLIKEQKFLSDGRFFRITPKGWAHIEKYNSVNPESNIAFIAMKFEDELLEYSNNWVENAITDAGYKPLRVDKHEHNDLIDDAIITNIKRSRFIIADLTKNSCGVYFEAGFARGMNIPVIYLCRKNEFEGSDKVHFDTNHYPIIIWENNKGEELRNKLKTRIEATIGIIKL